LNVGRRTIQRARVVLEKGIPELQAAVEAGQVSVSAASEVAKMPANRQREIVASGPKAVVAAAKKTKRKRAPRRAALRGGSRRPRTTGNPAKQALLATYQRLPLCTPARPSGRPPAWT
jgi:hypothetical protein